MFLAQIAESGASTRTVDELFLKFDWRIGGRMVAVVAQRCH